MVSGHQKFVESQEEGLDRILKDKKHVFLGAEGMFYDQLQVD